MYPKFVKYLMRLFAVIPAQAGIPEVSEMRGFRVAPGLRRGCPGMTLDLCNEL